MTPALRRREPRMALVPARILPLLLLLLLAAAPVAAQKADFLFGPPALTVSGSVGWEFPGEGSDLFTEARRDLLLSRGDFAAPLLALEAGIRLSDRFDLAFGLEHAASSVASEYADYVTADDQPIPQTTDFRRTRLTGSVKAYLLSRGRTISQYAWVPSAWSPYLGVGAGMTWYEFVRSGDFVDYQTLDIFSDRLRSRGSGATAHALAGVDISLSPFILLRAEYRYTWGRGSVDNDVWVDYNRIDLSGSRVSLGLGFRV